MPCSGWRDSLLGEQARRSGGGPRPGRSRPGEVPQIGTPAASSPRASFSGVWPPSCTITPTGLLALDHRQHVLEGQRLEVEAVGGVVVGRHRLRVAVDHHRLEAAARAGRRRRARSSSRTRSPGRCGSGPEPRMTTLRRSLGVGLVLLAEGGVEVGGLGRELGGAGVDPLVDPAHPVLGAGAPHRLRRWRPAGRRSARRRGRTAWRGPAAAAAREAASQQASSASSSTISRDLAQEPGIDARWPRPPPRTVHPWRRAAKTAHRRSQLGIAQPARQQHRVRHPALAGGQLPSSSSEEIALISASWKLRADRHHLADRLHAGAQGGPRARELLEGPARDLDHRVVEGGLEGGVGLAGDVVGDLVEGVADRQQGGDLGDREAGRLRGQRRATATPAGSSR